MDNVNNPKYEIDCILYSYIKYDDYPAWAKEMYTTKNPVCKIVKLVDSNYIYFLKALNPMIVHTKKYDYVTVVLDDVAHYPPHGEFRFEEYFDIIKQNNLAMTSPSVLGSNWSNHIGPRPVTEPNQVGRIVRFLEVQALTFRPDTWECFYDLVDTEFPTGWGIDLWFYDYCITSNRIHNATMGLIDTMHVQHNPFNLQSTHLTGAIPNITEQVVNWRETRNVELRETRPTHGIGNIYFTPKLK
jgi:hypothetical protein